MKSVAYQTTLQSTAICAGIGVHSGERARLTLKPAPVDTGILFRRTDAPQGARDIPGRGDYVHDVKLGTKLSNSDGTTLSTVEHLLAAIYGLGVDNIIIEVDGPEVPIMDGSSALFTDLILQSGLLRQMSPRRFLRVLEPIEVESGQSKAALLPVKDNGFHFDVSIEFPTSAIGRQRMKLELTAESFTNDIAFARTFGFMKELDQLHAMGLGQGASMENTIALGDDEVLNPEGLRAKDEFVRHKLLDSIGDLALIGHRVMGKFVANRPGHAINNLLVRKLLEEQDKWMLESLAPEYDLERPVELAAFR